MTRDWQFNEYRIYKKQAGYIVEVIYKDNENVATYPFGLPSQILEQLKKWWEYEEKCIHAAVVMPPPKLLRYY